MAEKQSNKDRIKEITAGIEQGIKELFESDRYRKYLTTMSRFHKYSLNNVMLIHSQRPDATLVAGFNKWKNSFGRHVKKGEKGIQILAPTPYKIKVEKEKLDRTAKRYSREKKELDKLLRTRSAQNEKLKNQQTKAIQREKYGLNWIDVPEEFDEKSKNSCCWLRLY